MRDAVFLRKVAGQMNVKLIYSNTGAVITGALTARLCKLPHLYHIHEIIVKPRWLAKMIARMVLGNASEVIAVSAAVREQLLRYYHLGDPPVRVIHNGIDPSPFDVDGDRDKTRREMGADSKNILYGVIGRIHPWKGQSYFIQAARLVADICPQARFAIIGGTFAGYEYLLDDLKKQIVELDLADRISILPYRKDVPDLMRALDVFVLPSTSPDPLPTVILEAMAAKRPVVATAHGGALEMVIQGKTGLLAPYDNVQRFAETLLELASSRKKRVQMGIAGRKRLEENFSLDRFYNDIHRCLDDYLTEKTPILNKTHVESQYKY